MAPGTSVIVPTRDRPQALRECLDSLSAQTGADPFEVVVVNDGGADPALPEDVVSVRHTGEGPGPARNAGAAAASGSLLIFFDDDCVAAPDWLAGLQAAHRGEPAAAHAGSTVNGLPQSRFAVASQVALDACHRYFTSPAGDAGFAASCNLAVPADGFREVGGFDPAFRFAEDRDFAVRWLASGRRIGWVPEARVEHRRRMGARGFLAQHAGYGRGAYALRRRGAPEPATTGFFHRTLAGELGGLPRQRASLAPLVVLTQVAAAAGFALEAAARIGIGRRRCGDPQLPMPREAGSAPGLVAPAAPRSPQP